MFARSCFVLLTWNNLESTFDPAGGQLKNSMPRNRIPPGGIDGSGYPRALSDKRATTEWLKLTKALGRQLAVLAQLSDAKLYDDDGGSDRGGDED